MSLRAASASEPIVMVHGGLVPYASAWELQRDLVSHRSRDEVPDVILTLEHPKVFTAGRRAEPGHLLWSEEERARRGVEFHRVDRGGDVTYHGPGQLVGYPVLRLAGIRRIVEYVRTLEDLCLRTAADFDVEARVVPGLTGVWVGDHKLVAIGVHVNSRAVTSHGFAFNVATDLEDFGGIVPCGLADKGVCSLHSLGVQATVADVAARLRVHVAEVFDCTVKEADLTDLGPARAQPDEAPVSVAPQDRWERNWFRSSPTCEGLRSPKTEPARNKTATEVFM